VRVASLRNHIADGEAEIKVCVLRRKGDALRDAATRKSLQIVGV
jgi:hypothetical protein